MNNMGREEVEIPNHEEVEVIPEDKRTELENFIWKYTPAGNLEEANWYSDVKKVLEEQRDAFLALKSKEGEKLEEIKTMCEEVAQVNENNYNVAMLACNILSILNKDAEEKQV